MKQRAVIPKKPAVSDLPRRVSPPGAWEVPLVVGEGALALIVNLAVMIVVERSQGQWALGVYSYLLSFYHLAAYGAEWGVPRHLERGTALNPDDPSKQAELLTDAFQAVCLLGLAATGFCFLSAAFDTSHTQIQEKMAAYFIIGFAIPLRNLNRVRMAALHGQGRHGDVARLDGRKRLVFLGTILALIAAGTAPSYLVSSFLVCELYLHAASRKMQKLPPLRAARAGFEPLRSTLGESSRYIFTDDALEVVLYIDILVLGVFLNDFDLGVYAEAAVLARFFLFIPTTLRPVFRRRFCVAVAHADEGETFRLLHKAASTLFFLNSLLALYLLLFYTEALKLFFHTRGEEILAFQLFEILVPGLLLCASVVACEPLYEALGLVGSLQKLVATVFSTNLALNIYLVPLAGRHGAALATMISMLLYFFLFGRQFQKPYRLKKGLYLLAGGAVYLIYLVLRELRFGAGIVVCMLPILVSLVFYCTDFFAYDRFVADSLNQGGDRAERKDRNRVKD